MRIDLPITYRKTRAWGAAFACPVRALEPLLPDPRLRPILVAPGTSALGVAVFDYIDTSVGPYGEVGLVVPCRYRRSTRLPLVPLLFERWLDDVGHWVQWLPVTTEIADHAGRTIWGFPKFVARIDIEADDARMRCAVSEDGRPLLSVEIQRPGRSRPLEFPVRTYSRLGDELLLTELRVDAVGARRALGGKARLTIERHPRTEAFASLPVRADRPIEVRWFDEYRTLLDRARARYRIGVA